MKNKTGAGYTLVEVMIVLAISGLLAVSAFTLVRGQQTRSEFTQAVRDFESKLVDVANDVAKGYFPNKGTNQQCIAGALGINFAATTDNQGESDDCVFAGKVLAFNPNGNDRNFQVLTLASRRVARDNREIVDISQLANNDLRFVPNLDDPLPLLYGLRVRSVRADGNPIGSFAFISGFAGKSDTGSLTGAPETDLKWLFGSTLGENPFGTLQSTTSRNPANYRTITTANEIEICVEHAAGGRTARITLGRSGRQLSTTTEIDFVC